MRLVGFVNITNDEVVSVCAKKFGSRQWSFVGPDSEKKWCFAENTPQGAWDNVVEERLLEFEERGHPTFRERLHFLRYSQEQMTLLQSPTIKTVFRIIISANQISIHGAMASICEEFENQQKNGSGEPEILMGQSIVLGAIKAEVLLRNENHLNHQILWQQYISNHFHKKAKWSRFFMEAGFVHVVEVG